MYTNIFDTVKNSDTDMLNFEGMLYSSILNGLHPTLSLNQAIDSRGLLTLVHKSESFCNLIDDGYIRVAVFGKYTGEHGDISTFLYDKLRECVDPEKASFKFSSLPFLYTEAYEESQLTRLFDAMSKAIEDDSLISPKLAHDIGMDVYSKDFNAINEYLKTIKKLEGLVQGRFTLHSTNNSKNTNKKNDTTRGSLFLKVLRDIRLYLRDRPDTILAQCLRDFRKVLSMQKDMDVPNQKLNSRGNMYEIIKDLKCSADHEHELKSLVDLCYNEVVAESIADDEEDIMVNNDNYEYTQVYYNNSDAIDKVKQKVSLVRNAKYSGISTFSWELLNEILREAGPYKNDPNQWYEKMQDYCERLAVESQKLGRRSVLRTTIRFTSNIVINFGLALLLKDPAFSDNQIVHVLIDSIGDAIKSKIPYNSQHEETSKIKKNKLIQSDVKPLLTQASLLKFDYNK